MYHVSKDIGECQLQETPKGILVDSLDKGQAKSNHALPHNV